MSRHMEYAEALVILLASDWSPVVRIEMAELLATLYAQNSSNIYLVNHLLAQRTPFVERAISRDDSDFYY